MGSAYENWACGTTEPSMQGANREEDGDIWLEMGMSALFVPDPSCNLLFVLLLIFCEGKEAQSVLS